VVKFKKNHISPTSVKGAPKIFIPLPLLGIRIMGNFKTLASPGSCGGDNHKKVHILKGVQFRMKIFKTGNKGV